MIYSCLTLTSQETLKIRYTGPQNKEQLKELLYSDNEILNTLSSQDKAIMVESALFYKGILKSFNKGFVDLKREDFLRIVTEINHCNNTFFADENNLTSHMHLLDNIEIDNNHPNSIPLNCTWCYNCTWPVGGGKCCVVDPPGACCDIYPNNSDNQPQR